MKKILILSLAFAALFGCVFGAGCITYEIEETAVKFTYSGGEASASLDTGDVITISAETNPSTGYSWTEPAVSDGLKIVGTGEYTDADPEIVGAGGFCYWDVTAYKPGTYTFTSEYKRPWEGKAIGKITVTLTFD